MRVIDFFIFVGDSSVFKVVITDFADRVGDSYSLLSPSVMFIFPLDVRGYKLPAIMAAIGDNGPPDPGIDILFFATAVNEDGVASSTLVCLLTAVFGRFLDLTVVEPV